MQADTANSDGETVCILGASARAAAMSALRSGFQVRAADLFADRDLVQAVPAELVQPYPDALPDWLARQTADAWLFTGALENHPDLLRGMASRKKLWGCSPDSVERVRDPWRLAEALARQGLATPRLARLDAVTALDSRRRWLRKPLCSAAGRGIVDWPPPRVAAADLATLEATHYFQQHVAGRVLSGAYLASQGQCELTGLSESWHGSSWTGVSTPYAYCGSLAPANAAALALAEARAIGQVAVDAFGLAGWFGVDMIQAEGRLWVLEVNPRYTASMELHDRLGELRLCARHVAACQGRQAAAFGGLDAPRDGFCGKAILHADRNCAATPLLQAWADRLNCDRPAFHAIAADLPHGEQTFTKGQPILTLIVRDQNAADVARRLRELVGQAQRLLR